MFAPRVLRLSTLILLATPWLAVGAQRAMPEFSDPDYMVMSRFLRAVDAYAVEHHRLFEPLSEEMMCLPEDTLERMNALADVPFEARRAPREGEIFAPDVADLFRRLLTTMLFDDESNPTDLMAGLRKDELIAPPICVNEAPPSGIGKTTAPWLAGSLPPLPDELEYRLVGRDLVLVDVPLNLVVDVVREALSMY